ncbi:hypothetical protein HG530_009836 [Fusarium avenaceum]|nr:hypothetical protein HG530_009836 [Fusarium avenaceum]
MRRINQITERMIQVMVPVTVNNSLASLCLITTLPAVLNTLRITLADDIGLLTIAMTGVTTVCRARWVVMEGVAEASWVRRRWGCGCSTGGCGFADVIVEEVGGAHEVEVEVPPVLDKGSEMVVEDAEDAEVVELCDVAEDEEIEETVVSQEVVVVDASVVLQLLESEVVQVELTLVEVLAPLDVQVLLEDSDVVEVEQDVEVEL